MTKYLLVIAVILLVLWWLKRERFEQSEQSRPKRKPALPKPTQMVRCAHCGTHLPEAEALKGQRGHYCDRDHRQRAEG